MAGPGYLGHCGVGLRAGGIEDQHINRAEAVSDPGGQPGNLMGAFEASPLFEGSRDAVTAGYGV